jgi:hypothetical protein
MPRPTILAGRRDEDATIVIDDAWETEGGRYGHRAYQYPDTLGWDEFWGTRIEDWGTRVFGTFAEAVRWVNTREDRDAAHD